MRTGLIAVLVSVSCGLSTVSARQASPTSVDVHRIDPSRYTDSSQFAFLTEVLKSVEIVSLGESMHFTHEFPLVRLGIIKHLNQQLGFRVLAMEGSATDIWAAPGSIPQLACRRRLPDSGDRNADLSLDQTPPAASIVVNVGLGMIAVAGERCQGSRASIFWGASHAR